MEFLVDRRRTRYEYEPETESSERDLLGLAGPFKRFLEDRLGKANRVSSLTPNPHYYSLVALREALEGVRWPPGFVTYWPHRLERLFFTVNRKLFQEEWLFAQGARQYERDGKEVVFVMRTREVTQQDAYHRYKLAGGEYRDDDILQRWVRNHRLELRSLLCKRELRSADLKKYGCCLKRLPFSRVGNKLVFKAVYERLKRDNQRALKRVHDQKLRRDVEHLQGFLRSLENSAYRYLKEGKLGDTIQRLPKELLDAIPLCYRQFSGRVMVERQMLRLNNAYYSHTGGRLFELRGNRVKPLIDLPGSAPGTKHSFWVALNKLSEFLPRLSAYDNP